MCAVEFTLRGSLVFKTHAHLVEICSMCQTILGTLICEIWIMMGYEMYDQKFCQTKKHHLNTVLCHIKNVQDLYDQPHLL